MNIKLAHILTLAAGLIIIHIIAIKAGLYSTEFIWIDKPQHLIGGIFSGLSWILILSKLLKKDFFGTPSPLLLALTIVGFALFLGFIWEVFEFVLFYTLPTIAKPFQFYSPSVLDLLTDLFLDVLGGLIIAVVYYYKTKHQNG